MQLDPKPSSANRYQAILERVFAEHHGPSVLAFEFTRDALVQAARALGITLPKNLGDLVYSVRYRVEMPAPIRATATPGREWIIEGAGRGRYRFRQVALNRVVPRADLVCIKIPDATPQIISAYALGDEQALLARVRYNRLIDVFLGITSHSLQNHLRTTVDGVGQIEIDEVYVGVDRHGRQFVVPVQAKGGSDRHGVVQTQQDVACCAQKFQALLCRPVSAQFMPGGRIALFELTVDAGELKVVSERHYELTAADQISTADLRAYDQRSRD